MNAFKNKQKLKITTYILLILMVFNFIIPNYSICADDDEITGGELFQPIAKLFCGFGDLFVKGLQEYFVGDNDIKEGSGEDAQFNIEYGPALIFSGKIPGLDANFVSGGNDAQVDNKPTQSEPVLAPVDSNKILSAKDYIDSWSTSGLFTEWGEDDVWNELGTNYGFSLDTAKVLTSMPNAFNDKTDDAIATALGVSGTRTIYTWNNGDKTYYLLKWVRTVGSANVERKIFFV